MESEADKQQKLYMETMNYLMKREANKTRKYSFGQIICYLLGNWDYVVTTLSLTFIYLIVSGLQYWITDYVQKVLLQPKETAFLIYIVGGAVGPIAGVAFSGCIFDPLGGYRGLRSPKIFSVFLGISALFGLLVCLTRDIYMFVVLLLVQMFTGGMTTPVLTGFYLANVPQNLHTQSSGIANLTNNLLGFFPAPSIYGYAY